MKWAYYLKHKLKAAAVLTVILLVIIGGNFVIRQRFSNMDKSMTSIYNDRLKPSAFIYQISHHLYEKRLLLSKETLSAAEVAAIQQHNNMIASLVQRYERTYLTNEERMQWTSFKEHLASYNKIEQVYTGNAEINDSLNRGNLADQFNKTIADLNTLNTIQVSVGQDLQKDTHTTVGSSMILSTLELSLLIILGLFTLVILSTSDNTLFKQYHNNVHLN